ncbi:MAG: 3-phosphoshikimate 1-carboxyvinyltransferase [Chloroflexi bacterium]|nr:3-phosphoshikimate 1-carboxyvinyltransferase [Chloroflexota bacterium]
MSKQLLVCPQKTPLHGTISVPGDKSISHRAVMLAALAQGTSVIRRWLPAGDTLATLTAVQSLGISVKVKKQSDTAWDLTIAGRGLHGWQAPVEPLNLLNAGTGLRLLAGLLVGQTFPSVLDGSEQLRKRPMRRITNPLGEMGADIVSENGRVPLSITPSPLQGIEYRMNVASAQVKSAILLAGLYAQGETRVYQPGPARDHTERMLCAMGVPVRTEGDWVVLPAAPKNGWDLRPLNLTIPADPSSAAFPLVAAAIVPHSKITIASVGLNPTRTGILTMLQAMGAELTVANAHSSGGEQIGDLTISFSELHSTTVRGNTVVCGIDELPIWAVAATQAAGKNQVHDAAELRVKEVDRISVLAGELHKLGVEMGESPDGFSIAGPTRLFSGEVDSHDDHRLGMSLAVAGLITHGPTLVHDASCINDSFPGFVAMMQSLGANMEWIEQ